MSVTFSALINFSLPFKYLCCVTFLSWTLSANFHCWTKTEAQSQKRREFIKSHFEFFNCRTFYFFFISLRSPRKPLTQPWEKARSKLGQGGVECTSSKAVRLISTLWKFKKSLCQPTATLLLFLHRHFLPTRWHHVKWCNFAKQDFCIRIKLSELNAASSITLKASW